MFTEHQYSYNKHNLTHFKIGFTMLVNVLICLSMLFFLDIMALLRQHTPMDSTSSSGESELGAPANNMNTNTGVSSACVKTSVATASGES
ncbi:hypothetical protein GUJ93_ZPchr0002g25683 [Zizania palustris]|uniref:Uncharacterized protein n=1 Tax=Zizania palustris TaxID=103762 RepID=A0A8J5S015_ZIZPA|nr:hypothetical protein GUJ93_ZPchr0002g25683 [Zizania palustris]